MPNQIDDAEVSLEEMLEDPSFRQSTLEYLTALQEEAELESLFERADEEMAWDLSYAWRDPE